MAYDDYFLIAQSDLSLEDKINILKENVLRSSSLNDKIRKLETPSINMINETDIKVGVVKKDIESQIIKDEEFEKLYEKISLLDISSFDDEEIVQKFKEIISFTNLRYNVLLSKVKLKLYSDIILYSNMITRNTTKKELLEIKNIINDIKIKLSILEQLTFEKDIINESNVDNNLFFLTSESGNVIALESLRKNIPFEYYDQFKELLISIKEGTFKGLKRFRTKPYFEVKDFKVRITFDKLKDGNYIILDAFMKKEDTSGYYRNMLANRTTQYLNSKTYYLRNIENSEFVSKHNDYYWEILNLLDSKKVILGGEDNESRSI